MNNVNALLKLNIEEIRLPYGSQGIPNGKLFTATPTKAKPRGITAEAWATSIVEVACLRWTSSVVVPSSFLPHGEQRDLCREKIGERRWIDLIDQSPDIIGEEGDQPQWALMTIMGKLQAGEDVLVLSSTKKISGFVPAILTKILHPNVHPLKIAYPITISLKYDLTPFQIGYLYGLSDARYIQVFRRDS